MEPFTRIYRGTFKRALVLEDPDSSLDRQLAETGIEVDRIDEALSSAEVAERVARDGHQLIFKRSRTPISRDVFEASDELMAVLLCCIGDDSVDKRAAAEHGVLVLNDPISNGRSVAELVLGEMVCLARRILDANAETTAHRFAKSNSERYELLSKRLGVLGLGNIGRQVASLGTALDMSVYFYDNREVAQEVGLAMGWRQCASIDELFRVAQVVSAHPSAEDWRGHSNEGLLTYEHFRQMNAPGKRGPRIFLNASRGFLHSAEDLRRAVAEGHIQSAFVDVFPDEPKRSGEAWTNPYADTPGIFTTPHIGAATKEAQPRIAARIATTTRLLNETGTVRDCVFGPGRRIRVEPATGRHILAVVHSDVRGTKKAVDDTIYAAGASNLQSAHRDFPRYSIAYDLNVLDRALSEEQLAELIERAIELTGDVRAIRSIRSWTVPKPLES